MTEIDQAAELLQQPVESILPVGGGRNSRVFQVRAGSRRYAMKIYYRDARDQRRRMETEFGALRFLWENGVRNVPEPLRASGEQGCAVYEWVDGAAVSPSEEAVDDAVRFLERLSELRGAPGSDQLPAASEACFSGAALVQNLERRLENLLQWAGDARVLSFLNEQLRPVLVERSGRLSPETSARELELEERTLSPSDFGFHNAIRRPSGEIVYLDFEYFGWDDPAKTVCDFLLHPGMALPAGLGQRFAGAVLPRWPGCRERVRACYPLFALKWCLILLNEFLPEEGARRQFAGQSPEKRTEQLGKARNMLRRAQTAA